MVIGAGPAGAFAAFELGRRGLRTLLIEAERLPRDKPCGGGLTAKVRSLLPFDLSPVVEQTVSTIELGWRLGHGITLGGERALVHMVRRSRFDAFLVEQAIDTGRVTLIDGTPVQSIGQDALGVTVDTPSGRFSAGHVIAADGARGVVARQLGALRERHLMPAIECDIEADAAQLSRWQGRLALDIGSLPGAYGWVFPKADHLNVGVGAICGPGARGSQLRAYAEAHRQHTVGASALIRRRVGYVLPLRSPGERIQWGRILLAGDAAGLVEAFTGEGIYWALRSGQTAALALATHLAEGTPLDYGADIDTSLMPDLLAARRWAHVYLWLPRACHALPVRSGRVWRAVEGLLTGERHFADLQERLGLLRPLTRLLPVSLP
jgi:geranylgeranyl reductase family protein